MGNEVDWLEVSFWISIVLAIPLLIASLMAVGKHAADLHYQKAANLNGIRWIQSWTNLRTHGNRCFFAAGFITTSILGIVDVEPIARSYIGRIIFIGILIIYLISAVLDWFAEHKQLTILLKYEEINKIPAIRLNLHKLNNNVAIYSGLVELLPKDDDKSIELNVAYEDMLNTIKAIQNDIRTMDPSYVQTRKGTGVENVDR